MLYELNTARHDTTRRVMSRQANGIWALADSDHVINRCASWSEWRRVLFLLIALPRLQNKTRLSVSQQCRV